MKLNGIMEIISIMCSFKNCKVLQSLLMYSTPRLMASNMQTNKSNIAINSRSDGGMSKRVIVTMKIKSMMISIIKIRFLNCINFSLF